MGFTKYQKAESAQVLPPEEQKAISDNLHSLGKTSARDLSEEERKIALDAKRV